MPAPSCHLVCLFIWASILPAVSAADVPSTGPKPTLYVIGDSTVRNGRGRGDGGQWGWGDFLAPWFDTNRIEIVNRALGGTSSRTFYRDRWSGVRELLQPGDFVMMQFGHNDSGPVNDDFRARGTIQGTGDETEAIDNLITHRPEVVHSFGWYEKQMVRETREKGAVPLVCSLIPRNQWREGKVVRNRTTYAGWAREVAASEHAPFLDLNEIIARQYEALGQERVNALFVAGAGPHTSLAGAKTNAIAVVSGLKGLDSNPLAEFLSAQASEVAPFCPEPGKSAQSSRTFHFGSRKAPPGAIQVSPTTVYDSALGYGFEPGAKVAGPNGAVSEKPFLFSVRVPEGSYAVTVTLGGSDRESLVTVKAEQRRLMIEKVRVAPGKMTRRTFMVNVRTPAIADGQRVRLKTRERDAEIFQWDDKLTLEFNGRHPAVTEVEIASTNVPTLFIAGDSTVCDQPAEPWNSWGQMLPRFFRPTMAVANYAESGESMASSLHAGRFTKIFSRMQAGDYLFLQFGHNDMKDKKPDALETYQSNLRKVIAEARSKGGTPVLITSMERKAGVDHPTLAGYPEAVREIARAEQCALIDLNLMSRTLYRALGDELDRAFQDGTHHNNYGSYELAQCVVEGLKETGLPLANEIVPEFMGFDPAHPDGPNDFEMPASPAFSTAKPLGN